MDENKKEPTAPAHIPMLTTEAIAPLGKTSETVVNRLAAQPWCAAAARLMSATATIALGANTPAAPTGMQKAQIAIAALRARPCGQPRRMREPEIQPPRTLPKPDITYTTATAQPRFAGVILKMSLRSSGNHHRYNIQTGLVKNLPIANPQVSRLVNARFHPTLDSCSFWSTPL